MTVELREYVPGTDDAEVIRLRARVWGEGHPYNDKAYFKWLFQTNPAGRGSGAILRRGGQIVGFAGLSARRMYVAGANTPVAQAVDYMVDVGARSGMSGMYGYRVIEHWSKVAVDHGYRFGIGFPNTNSSRLVTSPKLGWRPAFSPVLLVRPFGRLALPATPVRGVPPAAAAVGLAILAGWSRLSQALRGRSPPGRAVPLATFDSAFDELCSDMETPSIVGTRRDSAYLNWRYVENPLNKYDRVGWEVSGRMRGFVVTILRDVFGFRATLIVDLAAANEMPEIEFALLAETVRRSKEAGASLLATLAVDGSPRYRRLERFGFIPVPRRLDPKSFVLTTHGLGDAAVASLLETTQWQFNWADMDVV